MKVSRSVTLVAGLVFGALGCGSDTGTAPTGDHTSINAQQALAVGQKFSCAIAETRQAYCWGANDEGQLGNGQASNSATPSLVSGALSFIAITASDNTACGLQTDGETYCWGVQPGAGVPPRSAVPVAQHTPGLVSITVGHQFVCGLDSHGAAFCWGSNSRGQLGVGDTIARVSPTPVAGGLQFTTLSAGVIHTCGVATDTKTYCWGDDSELELGVDPIANAFTPLAAATTTPFAIVAAGGEQTCALTLSSLAAFCWGMNSSGQLGDGTTTLHRTPAPVAGATTFTVLRASRANDIRGAVCGVSTSGGVFCWGADDAGQVASTAPSTCTVLGTIPCVLTPTAFPSITTAVTVDVSDDHGCALLRDGSIQCWGANDSGQLGDGTTTSHAAPAAVVTQVRFP